MVQQAVRRNLITINPFKSEDIPTTLPKPKQKHHISNEVALRILKHLPNDEWRLLFALARWGGLRVPSEPELLRWSDVDWEQNRLTVHSPKTEHHEGRDRRIIPLFPIIKSLLEVLRKNAGPSDDFILSFMRKKSNSSFRDPLIRAIEMAGAARWSKLYTSLRATRDTELRSKYPSHVVDAWIGHDENVAKRELSAGNPRALSASHSL